MPTARECAREAFRITRKITATFEDGSSKTGSGFVGPTKGLVLTCAHVVTELNTSLKRLTVGGAPASVVATHKDIDLAELSTLETETSSAGGAREIEIGDFVLFAGQPIGTSGTSVFGGLVSAVGTNLVSSMSCRLFQINGMINGGNSGGPVLSLDTGEVVGVITAKYVPLLQEIDRWRDTLKAIPQFPSEVGLGKIDFAKFVNMTVAALASLSGTLRLVQVGTGYAIPLDLWEAKQKKG